MQQRGREREKMRRGQGIGNSVFAAINEMLYALHNSQSYQHQQTHYTTMYLQIYNS